MNTEMLLNFVMVFGLALYMITAGISVYLCLMAKVVPTETNWLGKAIVYNGVFNTFFWSLTILFLVVRKIGVLLLN
jgi:hypothetical protein